MRWRFIAPALVPQHFCWIDHSRQLASRVTFDPARETWRCREATSGRDRAVRSPDPGNLDSLPFRTIPTPRRSRQAVHGTEQSRLEYLHAVRSLPATWFAHRDDEIHSGGRGRPHYDLWPLGRMGHSPPCYVKEVRQFRCFSQDGRNKGVLRELVRIREKKMRLETQGCRHHDRHHEFNYKHINQLQNWRRGWDSNPPAIWKQRSFAAHLGLLSLRREHNE